MSPFFTLMNGFCGEDYLSKEGTNSHSFSPKLFRKILTLTVYSSILTLLLLKYSFHFSYESRNVCSAGFSSMAILYASCTDDVEALENCKVFANSNQHQDFCLVSP